MDIERSRRAPHEGPLGTSGVSRILSRGGGVQIFLEKCRLLRVLRACFLEKKINGCNLAHFEEYFAKILSKKNVKIVILYIKIIDNALLRTIFRGIRAYSPDFLSLVRFGVFWSIFSVNFLLRKYI